MYEQLTTLPNAQAINSSREQSSRPYGRHMIPTDWFKHHRAEDGEHVGYIAPLDDGFAAFTLLGHPLCDGVDLDDAETTLESVGLRQLAERWLLTVDHRNEPLLVEVVEVTPESVTVKHIDYGDDGQWGTLYTLDMPVEPSRLQPA